MDSADIASYVTRYEERLRRFGYSPMTLGWGKSGRQAIRFSVLAEAALSDPGMSVLDVGCGFGDLYDFLAANGWRGDYTGVDIVPGLLEVARERHPALAFHELDASVSLGTLPAHDLVVCSGGLNARLRHGDNEAHVRTMLTAMFEAAARIAACDFMTTHVDFRHEDAWHTDPAWAFGLALSLTRRAVLRADYMPYEFALILFKDDRIDDDNVFAQYRQSMRTGTL